MNNKIYACIDLKSFYASVECIERGIDPLTTNLVVADESRTAKTVCLAITPSLKQYGLSGRARLFEVIKKVKEINLERKKNNNYKKFINKSVSDIELKQNKNLELDYIIATPRMSHYIKYSTNIYNIYLKYIAPEDIYVYSIDEVFCDITNYLIYNNITPRDLVMKIILDVYKTTGITATAGIGTNIYLAKVAMDIVAKHTKPDQFGVRIAELDEMSYRKTLWNYKSLTSFWRVGKGYSEKLEKNGLYTMGDIAKCSLENEDLLYKLFGINAELLIDHAWGWEPCTIKDIKLYKPNRKSLGSSQVLHCPYDYKKTNLIVKEMADNLALNLTEKKLITNQLVLTIEYDIENLFNPSIKENYFGEIQNDKYGRNIPKHSHGTINLEYHTSSSKLIIKNISELYERIINKKLLVRKISVVANNLIDEKSINDIKKVIQYDLFTNYQELEENKKKQIKDELEENKLQNVLLDIKSRYGKNAILKGMNLEDGSTIIDRNKQIGGHKE